MEQKLRIGKPNVNIIEASGEITITENGTYDVGEYKTANVNVVNESSDFLTQLIERKFYVIPNNILESLKSIGAYAFAGSFIESIIIPNNILEIGRGAFSYCYHLSSVEIPNSVTSIGMNAFEACDALVNITLPNNLTEVDKYTFNGCSRLTSINLPENLTTIDWNAFYNCSSLASITFPASLTSIGQMAFYGCTSLNTIVYNGTVSQWNLIDKQVFWNNSVPATYVQCSDGQVQL